MSELVLDGSHGEGGGQILRSALTLSALLHRPVRLVDIRAGRPKPGLAAQHLTAVHAAAALCDAELEGASLGSKDLAFRPRRPVGAGDHRFDVAAQREGGSAGSAALVLQTVLLPLLAAKGRSTVEIRGGTHVPWSPTADYLESAWLPVLRAHRTEPTTAETGSGAQTTREGEADDPLDLTLDRWGFYPAGEGRIVCAIRGSGALSPATDRLSRALFPRPFRFAERGVVRSIRGRTVAANLPSHIPQRMTSRATGLLRDAGYGTQIEPLRVRATSPGALLFLVVESESALAGFTAFGKPGRPSEEVAEEAVAQLLSYLDTGAALDQHLADQLVLPAALAAGESRYSVERVSRHLLTVAWVAERFEIAEVEIEGSEGRPGLVTVRPVPPTDRPQTPER